MQFKTAQVVLKETFLGHGAKSLEEPDNVLNSWAREGWTLHTMTTTVSAGSGPVGLPYRR